MQQPAQPASEATGLYDKLADPEIFKHVNITSKLASLLGVANADQVCLQCSLVVVPHANAGLSSTANSQSLAGSTL